MAFERSGSNLASVGIVSIATVTRCPPAGRDDVIGDQALGFAEPMRVAALGRG